MKASDEVPVHHQKRASSYANFIFLRSYTEDDLNFYTNTSIATAKNTYDCEFTASLLLQLSLLISA